MYADTTVKIPSDKGKITRKTIKGTTYIYYQISRTYDAAKKYSVPKSTPVGKQCEDDADRMYPNEKYLLYCPDAEMPEEKKTSSRSACLRVGAYMVLRKIIAEYRLDEMLNSVIGKDAGLFMDLAVCSIITENNAGQYYPDYAFNHPLFTDKMKLYSDSKVSDFINDIEKDQSIAFQNQWNARRDHRQKICLSYDSTNKNCQAGDIDFVEVGHAKDNQEKPVINYAIAYDRDNSEPLFYEMYPGSVVDISRLHYTIEKAKSYGFEKIGFILDRGYFSKGNIRELDKNGYSFIIMMKGMKSIVRKLVLKHKGMFEESRKYSIRNYKVSGMTVKQKLFPSDESERYFHIYYNARKASAEREKFEEKVDQMKEYIKAHEGKSCFECPYPKYFDPVYHETDGIKTFQAARERYDAIDEEIKLCGYFVIITSDKMSAGEALDLYKSRDASEKLFRGDKSYLGNRCFGVHSTESAANKLFIEFVALIIRNKFYTCLKEQMKRTERKENYMTVPAALRELEKIEMIRQTDGHYIMNCAVTATQKEILRAFDMDVRNVRNQAAGIDERIQLIAKDMGE